MARKWWTLTAVVAGMFMLLLDVTIVNVALPQIQKAFGASLPDLQWIIDAYALTLAALMLTALLISAGGGWDSAKVIASLGAAGGLLAAFVISASR
jgi:MFS family permease